MSETTLGADLALIRKLIFSGLVAERFALGVAAALRPSKFLAEDADRSYGRLFTRGFGLRHFALGAGFLLLRKNNKSLAQFAVINAAVEAADALAILRESEQSSPPKTLAIGSLVGAAGCLLLAALASETLTSSPASISS